MSMDVRRELELASSERLGGGELAKSGGTGGRNKDKHVQLQVAMEAIDG